VSSQLHTATSSQSIYGGFNKAKKMSLISHNISFFQDENPYSYAQLTIWDRGTANIIQFPQIIQRKKEEKRVVNTKHVAST